MARLLILVSAFVCTACGHYRGMGAYKRPADYGGRGESAPEMAMDRPAIRNQLEFPQARPFIPQGAFKLHWPVEQVRINRGYRPSTDPRHAGVDLGGKLGAPIRAAHEGMVIYAGSDFRGYGKMVLIEYNNEWATLYSHLNEITAKQGRVVSPGDPIGEMGSTGKASGVHLHFELIRYRKPVDPLPYLTKPGRYASTARR